VPKASTPINPMTIFSSYTIISNYCVVVSIPVSYSGRSWFTSQPGGQKMTFSQLSPRKYRNNTSK
jgi:hypothetical protein